MISEDIALLGLLTLKLRATSACASPLARRWRRSGDRHYAARSDASHTGFVTQPMVASINARFLIRRSRILLLHQRRELVEVLLHQRDVFLELYRLCGLQRRREVRQLLFLFRLRDGFVGLEAVDLLLEPFGWLGELLGLRIDAEKDQRDVASHVVVFVEACKAVLLGERRGLRVHLRIRFVRIRALVELGHALGGRQEAFDLLLGELDLFYLLRSGRAGIQKRERKQPREPTEKPPARGQRASVANERHDMGLHLDTSSLCTPQF